MYSNKQNLAAKSTITRPERRSSGNILVFGLVAAVPLLMLFLTLLRLQLLGTVAQRSQTAAEAASLAAAADLSKIVVNDPYYGFVALSDYGPYGKCTLAADGESLPVLGINGIVATARLQTLLADQLNNDELRRLAQEDVQAARRSAKLLGDALNASLQPGSRCQAHDMDGNVVKPLEHAFQIYSTNLKDGAGIAKTQISKFRLTLGWLKDGSDSNTKSPLPEQLAAVPATARIKGNYRAFIDIPACGESFYFAGLSPQPSLARTDQFMNPDGKRFCSIVKVDADILLAGSSYGAPENAPQCLHTSACAQPSCLPDIGTPGVLAISFKHGLVPGINSIQHLLDNEQLNNNKVDILTADGGDFPIDLQAKLISAPRVDSVKTVSQTFAMGLHDWLRTAHNKPRLDSVIDAVSEPFVESTRAGSGPRLYPNLFYEIDANGRVCVRNLRQNPFFASDSGIGHSKQKFQPRLTACIYDQQDYALNFNAIIAGSYSWMMVYRNYTRALGTASGGKHAGQVLPGDPVNWCELSRYGSGPEQAFEKGKGEKALGLQAQGAMYDESAVMLEGAHFTKRNGSPLSNQPRRSHYSGGLAVYFELSSPIDPALTQS